MRIFGIRPNLACSTPRIVYTYGYRDGVGPLRDTEQTMPLTMNDRIRALEAEASSAGDILQVALCRRALAHDWDIDAVADLRLAAWFERAPNEMTRADARQECERALATAAAAAGSAR